MGYLEDRHGLMMFKHVPSGTCEMCAVEHDEAQPHNKDSMTYQYKFYDQNGRWPTWNDAMSHCSDEVKKVWIEALAKKGVNLDEK